MAFNLGTHLEEFEDLTKGLETSDWMKAANDMLDSKWYCQVKCRAVRLITRMRKMSNEEDDWGVCISDKKYYGTSCCTENNSECFEKCFLDREGTKC